LADNTTFDSNEIAYNGLEQKVGRSANVTFRNNYVHNNVGDGIWYDSNANAGALIDANRVEDNGRNGIFFEASIGGTISNNTLRRNTWDAVMISMSQNAQIYNNTLEGQFRGHRIFPQLRRAGWRRRCQEQCGARQHDRPRHAELHVREQLQFHLLVYLNTACAVSEWIEEPDRSRATRTVCPHSPWDRYFLWGGWKGWVEWQVLGQDAGGSLTQ
jgi:parallel beta-helix repeat protein